MEPFIGQIQAFGFNFAPRGWALCQGQLMSIAQNSALFSLLGTMYGGDGRTTFGLPDLRGRSIVGFGQGPGLSPITQGEKGGAETVTLLTSNMPVHNHMVTATDSDANSDEAGNGARLGTAGANIYASGGSATVHLAADSTTPAGGNVPFNNRDPYLGLNYCIALEGIFPSRS
ncbi:MAG: phage tail protein [Saprospiraceae bacterium]|nr:phage tail protein [Saprospiraceae bacterium]